MCVLCFLLSDDMLFKLDNENYIYIPCNKLVRVVIAPVNFFILQLHDNNYYYDHCAYTLIIDDVIGNVVPHS